MGHEPRTSENYCIPDVFAIPTELVLPLRGLRELLKAYEAQLPLVAEVCSPSTGEYDVDAKLPEYQRRGGQVSSSLSPPSGGTMSPATLKTWSARCR